jgi:hypothetical protein
VHSSESRAETSIALCTFRPREARAPLHCNKPGWRRARRRLVLVAKIAIRFITSWMPVVGRFHLAEGCSRGYRRPISARGSASRSSDSWLDCVRMNTPHNRRGATRPGRPRCRNRQRSTATHRPT